ncbi:LPS export ABC transporter permease LptF [Tritonibacter scottomollicae]|uniref:Lipopolysaccharide export system permease protein n=1 Tax=Tritonibacter scottomollicae TaxID=483013 RepID=A0A2T1ACZ1_TRISK|nr:LPS export ABC transporter permease LptF [Tritonibacter scottomollicae]PRZ46470.1 lipopolysaccharide export system permease protein [Tritonibacter scottomollicae]
MSRYDRYVLSQYLLFFGFFALILVAVFWINRAVSLFDWLIGDGQSVLAFLEISALSLPNLVRMVLPLAAFAATVWVTNRLNSESELTVLRATGSSPWQLARPAMAFGVIGALMMSALSLFLLPASLAQMDLREAELARSVSAKLLKPGSFLHPTDGVTFFIGSIDDQGTLNNVFLNDQRSSDVEVTYTSDKAYLVRDGDEAHLILVDGLAQRQEIGSDRLSTTAFADFSQPLGAVSPVPADAPRPLRNIPTLDLLQDRDGITQADGHAAGAQAEELHLRFARATVTLAVVMIAVSALMLGGFSRFGIWKQLLGAFCLLILIEGLRGVVSDPVLDNAAMWPIVYLPSALGLLIAVLFLHLASRPQAFSRQRFRRETAT